MALSFDLSFSQQSCSRSLTNEVRGFLECAHCSRLTLCSYLLAFTPDYIVCGTLLRPCHFSGKHVSKDSVTGKHYMAVCRLWCSCRCYLRVSYALPILHPLTPLFVRLRHIPRGSFPGGNAAPALSGCCLGAARPGIGACDTGPVLLAGQHTHTYCWKEKEVVVSFLVAARFHPPSTTAKKATELRLRTLHDLSGTHCQ